MCVEVIVCYIIVVFLRHGVVTLCFLGVGYKLILLTPLLIVLLTIILQQFTYSHYIEFTLILCQSDETIGVLL